MSSQSQHWRHREFKDSRRPALSLSTLSQSPFPCACHSPRNNQNVFPMAAETRATWRNCKQIWPRVALFAVLRLPYSHPSRLWTIKWKRAKDPTAQSRELCEMFQLEVDGKFCVCVCNKGNWKSDWECNDLGSEAPPEKIARLWVCFVR